MWVKSGDTVINLDRMTGFVKTFVDGEPAIKIYTIVDSSDSWNLRFSEEEGGSAARNRVFAEIFERMQRGDEYFDIDYWLENEVIM